MIQHYNSFEFELLNAGRSVERGQQRSWFAKRNHWQCEYIIPLQPMFPEYDVIVVGAGHAGCEAAAAIIWSSKTLLITMNMQTIAQMSCNPAMGGIAKGQIVRKLMRWVGIQE